MVRLQTAMGAEGVRWCSHVTCAIRPHMAARHSPLQQVSLSAVSLFHILITSSIVSHYILYTYSSGTACCREIEIDWVFISSTNRRVICTLIEIPKFPGKKKHRDQTRSKEDLLLL